MHFSQKKPTFAGMKEESEQILIEKFQEIRADHEKYGRERIIDAWQMQSLFRNELTEKRIEELEDRLFYQNCRLWGSYILIGILLGIILGLRVL